MLEGIQDGNSTVPSLQRNLSAAIEKAKTLQKTQLIFVNESPIHIGNRIINERCIFLHPDGRITSIENKESALKLLADWRGEVYLPEHIVVNGVLLYSET